MITGHVGDGAFDVGEGQVIHIDAGIQGREVLEECTEVVVRMAHVVHRAHLAYAVHRQLHGNIYRSKLKPFGNSFQSREDADMKAKASITGERKSCLVAKTTWNAPDIHKLI